MRRMRKVNLVTGGLQYFVMLDYKFQISTLFLCSSPLPPFFLAPPSSCKSADLSRKKAFHDNLHNVTINPEQF